MLDEKSYAHDVRVTVLKRTAVTVMGNKDGSAIHAIVLSVGKTRYARS